MPAVLSSLDVDAFWRDGFTVLRRAVPAQLCNDLVAAIDDVLGIVGPQSWYGRPRPFLDIVPMWGHPAQWAIRQLPALHQAWSALHGTDDLLVSLDRCRCSPPWRPGEPDALPLHWDHDPRDPDRSYIQGAVALTDTPAGAGGFRCAPGWHRTHDRWPVHAPDATDWPAGVPDEEVTPVPMGQGDLVMWTSRLPHANSKNESPTPRYAFYVLMAPYDEDLAHETSACWESGRCPGAWCQLPGHGHAEPWAPVALEAGGRRLVGLDRPARRRP